MSSFYGALTSIYRELGPISVFFLILENYFLREVIYKIRRFIDFHFFYRRNTILLRIYYFDIPFNYYLAALVQAVQSVVQLICERHFILFYKGVLEWILIFLPKKLISFILVG